MTVDPGSVGPPVPERDVLPDGDGRSKLVANVREALRALPFHFASHTVISGLEALDLFSLNTVLGGTIEIQTVATLNRIRRVWDPDDEWSDYGFVRSSQTFPDVRLVKTASGSAEPAMGIELKGWYLLAKERAPSYRYTAARGACSIYDLLVVVPWHLSDVLSGAPVVRDAYIEQARFAADYRNYYWQHQRSSKLDGTIVHPQGVHPYPSPKAATSDKAAQDSGGNFGRVARVHGLMDDYITATLETRISGIEAAHWIEFFKVFADASDPEQVRRNIRRFLRRHESSLDEDSAEEIVEHLVQAHRLLGGETPSDL